MNDSFVLLDKAEEFYKNVKSYISEGHITHKEAVQIGVMVMRCLINTYPGEDSSFDLLQEANAFLDLYVEPKGDC